MVSFKIDDLLAQVKKAIVNESLGVEKTGAFYVHEAQAEEYLKSVTSATEQALREKLCLTN